jgi:carboxyl-terminal processing protease
MKKILIVLSLIAAAPVFAFQGARESSADVRRQTFDIVWRTVKEKHFDPTLGGVDWDKVREQYAPRVETVKSDRELYRLLQQMLGELHQSHFAIIPPEAVIEEGPAGDSSSGIGIDLRIVDGVALITRVWPDSAAARAGLRAGFVIKQIDQTPAEQFTSRVSRAVESQAMVRLLATRALLSRTEGKPDTTVRIVYLDENNREREAAVKRERVVSEMSEPFGNFPAQRVETEVQMLGGGIGYIRFNIFVPLATDRVLAAIRSMKDARGIIFDLRGNPGGMGGLATRIAGLLETREKISLGTMKMRAGHQNFVIFPQSNPFTGKVALLIDGSSGSTSEIFAAGLQESGRAIIVGEKSMGAALPSIFSKLPTGALFQYAFADFRTPKGVLVEGRGVIPDVEVKPDRRELLRGRDNQLDAAIEQIRKQAVSTR